MSEMKKRGSLYAKFDAARRALKRAKADADDNGWLRSSNWYETRQREVQRAQERYDKARAAWEGKEAPHAE